MSPTFRARKRISATGPTGQALPGGLFVNGSQIPTDVSRSLTGAVITWDFTGTNAVNLLPPGTTTFVLVVETDATNFTAGTVSAQDGGANTGRRVPACRASSAGKRA